MNDRREIAGVRDVYSNSALASWRHGDGADIINKFYTELAAVMKLPEVRDVLIAQGTDPVASSPAEFRCFIEGEIEKWTKVARAEKVQL